MHKLTERQEAEKLYFDAYFSSHPQVGWDSFKLLQGQRRPYAENWFALSLLLEEGIAEKSVLDIGCGKGTRPFFFAKAGAARAIGFDVSDAAIRIANDIKSSCGEKRAEFFTMACEEIGFPDESFDYVFGENILHHVDIPKTINETRRVLKKGGKAVFCEWVESPLFDRIRNSKIFVRAFPHGGYRSKQESYVTAYEKKLTQRDLDFIKGAFSSTELYYRYLFTRIAIFLHVVRIEKYFQIFDYNIMKIFPFLNRYAAAVIIKCVK